jgi:hypothetical protein
MRLNDAPQEGALKASLTNKVAGMRRVKMAALSGTAESPGVPGVRGDAAGTDNDGVQGFTASPARAGVIGINSSAGVGIKGVSEAHDAMQGFAKHPDHAGVLGTNDAGTGVRGQSISGDGVLGLSQDFNRAGVVGSNTAGVGVRGASSDHDGVQGFTSNMSRAGVVGTNTGPGNGVLGQSEAGTGVHAVSTHGTGLVASGARAGFFDGDVRVEGNIHVTGDVILSGADYAEALTTHDNTVIPGMVTVLGEDGEVHPCTRDYDTAVAGIVSGAGGVKPAIVLDRHEPGAHIALMGKAWCLADADIDPIRPGDLLSTSTTTGHCRRVSEPQRASGSMIGKALSSLAEGKGLILVLVGPR